LTDLRRDFPDMTGLSARNLKYMRAFAEAHPDRAFVQQVVARLPWGHVVRLLENAKDATRREWYARQAIEHGWSRNVLVHQIESNLYERQGKALTNFSRTLPALHSELAQQLIKDPYSFDFLALGPDLMERDLERGLLEHLLQLQALKKAGCRRIFHEKISAREASNDLFDSGGKRFRRRSVEYTNLRCGERHGICYDRKQLHFAHNHNQRCVCGTARQQWRDRVDKPVGRE
jgi:predicted nuclease of restriction endonuclease-like (RecB) superfamily